jgi:hypothetical protein
MIDCWVAALAQPAAKSENTVKREILPMRPSSDLGGRNYGKGG